MIRGINCYILNIYSFDFMVFNLISKCFDFRINITDLQEMLTFAYFVTEYTP